MAGGGGRSPAVDRLRGLAVALMVPANMIPYSLEGAPPMSLRVLATFPAPAFVALSGFVAARSRAAADPRAAAARGAVLLAVGAALDVGVWRATPLVSADVLVLLGVGAPLVALAGRLPLGVAAALSVAVIGAGPAAADALESSVAIPGPLHSLLVSGWFPLLPWCGVLLAGAAASRAVGAGRAPDAAARAGRAPGAAARAWLSVAVAAVGGLSLALARPEFPLRGGYAELFYPARPDLLAVALAAVVLAGEGLARLPASGGTGWLEDLGRGALLAYVVHTAAIGLVLRDHPGALPLPGFVALAAAHVAALVWLARRAARLARPGHPLPLRMLLGVAAAK